MICFLFGAGAENPFEIIDGKEFAKTVVGINCENMNNAIYDHYKSVENGWYPDYHTNLKSDVNLVKAAIRKKLLDEYIVEDESKRNKKDESDNKEDESTKKNYDEEAKRQFEEIKNDETKKDEIISEYTSYMGLLDEYFHTLINPRPLGPYKFWNVITCYTRAYLSIIKCFYGDKQWTKEDYSNILNDPIKAIKNVKMAAQNMSSKKENYYDVLKNLNYNFKVVTTNYTPLCEIKTGVKSRNIAYVHGKLGWFEDPYTWSVYDVNDENFEVPKDSILFPYLFIQSGVKPIVERKQICEYYKMIRFFDKSSKIIITGYRINCDDNHLNGMIRNCIMRNQKVIYLDFDKNSNREKILNRLHINADIQNFIWKPINSENCIGEFKNAIEND